MKVPRGFLFSGLQAGIKKSSCKDLGLIWIETRAESICFFTENKVKAAPVVLNMEKLKKTSGIRGIIVNSGNANCFVPQGLKDARIISQEMARLLGVKSEEILIASTGVIGKRLPLRKILKKLVKLRDSLDRKNFRDFAEAILTTDTFPKLSGVNFKLGKKEVNILGIAKGAGMIFPQLKNHSTMLGFILTDIGIKRGLFKKSAEKTVEVSFNSISGDGCQSTNDSLFFLASNSSGVFLDRKDKNFYLFSRKLTRVGLELAQKIIRDVEGSTKFIRIIVKGAGSQEEARKAGFSIANSSLFKASVYGQSLNKGRIVAALGQNGFKLRPDIFIKMSSVKKKKIDLMINLKRGRASWIVYTSDLTPEYVKINASYS